MSQVLDAAGILATARFVLFEAFEGSVDIIDMLDALHPQIRDGDEKGNIQNGWAWYTGI